MSALCSTLGVCFRRAGMQTNLFAIRSSSLRRPSPNMQLMRPMTSSTAGIQLVIDKPECLMDEDIVVKATGLSPNNSVTILATAEHNGKLFWSHGLFRANDRGVVDLSTDTPINGSYNEADPAGLVWSMVAAPWLPQHKRMFQAQAIKPRVITFSVFPESDRPCDYLNDKTKLLASVEHKRWYKSSNTRRIPIDHPRIRGTLFLPEGPGPFPGVIDIYGGLVPFMEGRAALLASRGFATMALAYMHEKGLPQKLRDIDLSYFEEAEKWFASIPEVRSDGLGVSSLCLGGAAGFWMAQNIPNIRAVVSINGMPFGLRFWAHNGLDMGYQTSIDETQIELNQEAMSITNVFSIPKVSFFKPWIHGANLLVILGGDDLMMKKEHNVRLFEELMPPDYRHEKAELELYPGAGHLIEPPNTPLSRVIEGAYEAQIAYSVKELKYQHNDLVLSGGYPKEHAAAQRGAWQQSLKFLKKHLF
ncbi:bile acid-CoA:amino acid N-acyltransferase-like isoform X2 [Mizuhopecten yessoensis]|uniref:bile acid-CoA:amino acid N-acyltransferase-like isoform X2 n=1 Tax=Mizuhopecten yessoensis TaxID=6573 RepID=UPI000B45D80F|nr:bile acid-CoA:amino acid N-acyltransferase-like isoform X2 [Mizuhopecten yessoensis]